MVSLSSASTLRRRRGSVFEGRRLNHQSPRSTVRPSRWSTFASSCVGEMVFDLLQGRFLVFYFGVDLTRADVGVDGGEEPGDGLFLAADELGYGQHGDDARVGEVVVPEVEVGRVLPAEGRVVLSHLRLDDGVARLGPYGLPALALDEFGERFRADRAVEYGRPRLLLQHVLRYEGGGQVARDGRALLVDDEAPVGVAVEGIPRSRHPRRPRAPGAP